MLNLQQMEPSSASSNLRLAVLAAVFLTGGAEYLGLRGVLPPLPEEVLLLVAAGGDDTVAGLLSKSATLS